MLVFLLDGQEGRCRQEAKRKTRVKLDECRGDMQRVGVTQ